MSISDPVSVFQETVEPYFSRVLAHPLYKKITGLEQLRIFTAHHVYAVWDFMCLLNDHSVRELTLFPFGN